MDTLRIVDAIGLTTDVVGVVVIVVGGIIAAALAVRTLGREGGGSAYRGFRRNIGRAILLGLEILVAGDIIRTVAVEPTFDSVLVLGGIVLIRTFLSFSLEVELTGSWPWRRGRREADGDARDEADDEVRAGGV